MYTVFRTVADTVHDLIADTAGAIVVALMGWGYFKAGRYSFMADGVQGFVRKNPGYSARRAINTKPRPPAQSESERAGFPTGGVMGIMAVPETGER